ncbi:MAG: START domain-containing protein [Paludibacter sp.]|nr:START domain-containing protein [Paludibacter sp.]
MKNKYLNNFFVFFVGLSLSIQIHAQSWKFIKEKDGIKLYSRQETGNKLQTFKGVSKINIPVDQVFELLEDVNHREWWDKNLDQIKLLKYEKDKLSQYYLVYKMPWPFTNRDMYVEVTTSINQSTGEHKLTAVPLAGTQKEYENLVRIKNYKQQWIIKPLSKDITQVELEFYVSPAENLPDWLINMILIDSPINSINGLRAQFKK